jgi:hypothetical protein
VRSDQAARLARQLLAAFPTPGATAETLAVFARRLEPWELGTAERAVERLIDHCRGFPRVVELREAYQAEGGQLPDAGRDMSPPVRRRPPLSERDQREADAERAKVLERARDLAVRMAEPPDV